MNKYNIILVSVLLQNYTYLYLSYTINSNGSITSGDNYMLLYSGISFDYIYFTYNYQATCMEHRRKFL